jgi:hypothetical protein
MLRKFSLIFFFIILVSPLVLFAQGLGNSPYSRVGVGDLVQPVTIQNLGAGGLSVAGFNQDHIHLNNPALSTNKKGLYRDSLVKLEGAFTMQYKQFSTSNATETVSAANLRYVAVSIPIGKVWNTTLAIQPYSIKSHKYSVQVPVQGDPEGKNVEYSFQGKGGIYEVAFNNGIGISKSLSAGLGLGYLFGPATSSTTSVLLSDPNASVQNEFKYGIKRRINHSALGIKPAVHYRKEIYRDTWVDSVLVKKPQGVFWNVGVTGEFYTPMRLKVQESLIRESPTGITSEDSVTNNYAITGALPSRFNLGFSIDRPNKWMVGVEGGISDWSSFRYGTFTTETYRVAWNVGLGGEIRPGKRRQLKTWTYRAGVNYSTLPYALSGIQIKDMSVSLGATIPVGTRFNGASFPKLNIAFVLGQRGTLDNGLAKELYGRLHLSVLITDKWFTKRKIQ